ncbi:MAG: hypothetical protein IPL06_19620 [Betaproteobacteria bacterium]|nr:hypothetical protein [Betaproteobacteria bacterium]
MKKIKALSPAGIAYLRESRRFHFVVVLDRSRQVFVDHTGGGQRALVVAREAIELIVTHLVNQGRQAESVKCARVPAEVAVERLQRQPIRRPTDC